MANTGGSVRKGSFFHESGTERVEISLVEVYERGAKSVIAVCERT